MLPVHCESEKRLKLLPQFSDFLVPFKLNKVIPTIFDFHTIQSVQLQIEVPFTAKKSANFFELLDLLFFDGRIVQFGL